MYLKYICINIDIFMNSIDKDVGMMKLGIELLL